MESYGVVRFTSPLVGAEAALNGSLWYITPLATLALHGCSCWSHAFLVLHMLSCAVCGVRVVRCGVMSAMPQHGDVAFNHDRGLGSGQRYLQRQRRSLVPRQSTTLPIGLFPRVPWHSPPNTPHQHDTHAATQVTMLTLFANATMQYTWAKWLVAGDLTVELQTTFEYYSAPPRQEPIPNVHALIHCFHRSLNQSITHQSPKATLPQPTPSRRSRRST